MTFLQNTRELCPLQHFNLTTTAADNRWNLLAAQTMRRDYCKYISDIYIYFSSQNTVLIEFSIQHLNLLPEY